LWDDDDSAYNSSNGGVTLGGVDIFVNKLDKSGEWQWAVRVGTPADDVAQGLVIDRDGDLFVGIRAGSHTRLLRERVLY